MSSPLDHPSRELRRRLFWLAFVVIVPVALLAAVAARSIRYETLAAREQAIADAKILTNWAGVQSQELYFPIKALLALLPHENLQALQQSPLLRPTEPSEDFVVQLQNLTGFAGHQLHTSLLDREGRLLYPTSASSGADSRSAWSEVTKLHDRCRTIHGRFSAGPDAGAAEGSPLFRFLEIDGQTWCTWRLENRSAGYQLLFALPEKEFHALAASVFDPGKTGFVTNVRRSWFGPGYASPDSWRVPFKDYMQLAVLLEGTDTLLYAARRDLPVTTSLTMNAKRYNERSELQWADREHPRVLADSGSSVLYVGPWAPVRTDTRDATAFFRFVVSVGDRDLLAAHVRRRTWLFAGLIGLATVGSAAGLRAGWRAYRDQQRLSTMKSNFISTVSHELRTPLASVRLMAEGLQRGSANSPEKRAEYYRLIVQECHRVSALVENVLDLSRIEQGRKQYAFEWCDVDRLCRETTAATEPVAAAKEVRVAYTSTGTPAALRCDAGALQQVLVNLVDNAIKHSPPGETVSVTAAFEPNSFRLVVADRGPGIPQEDRARIFEPFYRRGSELRRETIGVGLGLTIVKHAIDAHGGTIHVEDNTPAGTRFVIALPTSARSAQPVSHRS